MVFSSEPPLPQEQIVSLLATGETTAQLGSNNEALAGKAAFLVLQDLYHKAFPSKPSATSEPGTSLADRVTLDLGEVDPETGKQEASAGFKITDTLQFLGQFGVQGDLNGRIKYLIRFH